MSPLPESTANPIYTDDERSLSTYFFEKIIKPTDVLYQTAGDMHTRKKRLQSLGIKYLDNGYIEETLVQDREIIVTRIRVYPTNKAGVFAQVEWNPKAYSEGDGLQPIFDQEFSRSSLRRLGAEAEKNYLEMIRSLPVPNVLPLALLSPNY